MDIAASSCRLHRYLCDGLDPKAGARPHVVHAGESCSARTLFEEVITIVGNFLEGELKFVCYAGGLSSEWNLVACLWGTRFGELKKDNLSSPHFISTGTEPAVAAKATAKEDHMSLMPLLAPVVLGFCVATTVAEIPATQPTQEAVKQMLHDFSSAMRAGNVDALQKMFSTSGPESAERIKAGAEFLVSSERMNKALIDRFGEKEANQIAAVTGPSGSSQFDHFAEREWDVQGNRATCKDRTIGLTLAFKDGRWQIADDLVTDEADAKHWLSVTSKATGVYDEMAKDLRDGKAKTPAEAVQLLKDLIKERLQGDGYRSVPHER